MQISDFYWADSDLLKIEISYDEITLLIHNDVSDRELTIKCQGFVGISEVICGDEAIIETISCKKLTEKHDLMLEKIKERYPFSNPTDMDELYKLHVVLINDVTFDIICKEVLIEEKIYK